MKSVSTRFLIPFGITAVLISALVFYQTYKASRKHANELLSQQAAMALEFNLAIRDYAGETIRPAMEKLVGKDGFMPETMSTSFISRGIFDKVRKKFPDYIIRFSSDSPRNPINMANPDEMRIIEYFRRNPLLNRRTEEIEIDGKRYMAHFTPKRTKQECMHCHDDPKNAPAELVGRYGATASFHRKLDDVAGLDTVAVPLDAASAVLASEMRSQSIVLVAGLTFLFGVIFFVFRFVVTKRLLAMASHFNEIASHAESSSIIPIEVQGNDEITAVSIAFNKLVEQLHSSHASLEQLVSERTEELRNANTKLRMELTERKRAEDALHRSNARISHLNDVLRAIREVSIAIKHKMDPLTLLTEVCNSLVQTRGYIFVWIGQPEAGSKLVLPVAHSGAGSDFLQHAKITWDDSPTGRGPAGTAMRERRPVIFDDLVNDPHFALWKDPVAAYGAASIASVPLLHHERLFGVLTVKADRPQAFDAEEIIILSALAADVARALQSLEDERAREQAEQAVRSLEEQLQRAEKMEALGTMAGGVAHDLNNVLGVVIGYSELLLNVGDSRSAKSHVTEILKAGQRAATIVQDLLTLTRRGVMNRQVLNLNNIVIECQKLPEFTKLVSYYPKVQIRTDLEANLLNISGSSVHIGKTFMNLISNAAEAMPNGGVITVKTENQYLDKPVSGYDEVKDGDYIAFSVSDEGEGIAAVDLKRIFEPFYTKKVMGRSGTGLGLTVVWGTVKDHQGYINVESQEGNGTTFTLYFPVSREELPAAEVPASVSEYMGKGESVLVVDDVKEQRELAIIMLTKLNYIVTSVSSGEEAIQYIRKHPVDLAVLDMIMDPGMDGLDTYAKILEIHAHQKAIIVSGFSETERVSKVLTLGAGAYVKKPYVLEKLGLAVRKELDRTR